MSNGYGLNTTPQAFLQGFDAHADVKGKGKFKETDFDAAFAQAATSITATTAKIETQSSGDAVDELEKDFSSARLDDAVAATPEGLLGSVGFKRSVLMSALASVVRLMIFAFQASGSRCRILICLPNQKKWQSGKQSLINS